MQTPIILPQTQGPRPHKRARLLSIVAVVIVLAILGSGVVLVANEPLREGSIGGLSGPSFEAQKGVEEHARVVTYESGQEMIIDFSLRNVGPLAVTVTGISNPAGSAATLFEIVEIRAGRYGLEPEPFAPFKLGRNEERLIRLRGILKGCGGFTPRSSIAWNTYPVRYRVLGISRTMDVQTRSPVIIEIPADFNCPEPPTYPTP